MEQNSFLSTQELKEMGFAALGQDVRISRFARFYAPQKMRIGSHVRIDDFCILSGCVTLGSYIHISAYSGIFAGDFGVEIGDYATVSSRVCIYAQSDDFSGAHMTNPTVPERLTGVSGQKVVVEKHAAIGTGSTLLPGARLCEGAVLGAMSLAKSTLEQWTINAGVPCRFVRKREMLPLELEKHIGD